LRYLRVVGWTHTRSAVGLIWLHTHALPRYAPFDVTRGYGLLPTRLRCTRVHTRTVCGLHPFTFADLLHCTFVPILPRLVCYTLPHTGYPRYVYAVHIYTRLRLLHHAVTAGYFVQFTGCTHFPLPYAATLHVPVRTAPHTRFTVPVVTRTVDFTFPLVHTLPCGLRLHVPLILISPTTFTVAFAHVAVWLHRSAVGLPVLPVVTTRCYAHTRCTRWITHTRLRFGYVCHLLPAFTHVYGWCGFTVYTFCYVRYLYHVCWVTHYCRVYLVVRLPVTFTRFTLTLFCGCLRRCCRLRCYLPGYSTLRYVTRLVPRLRYCCAYICYTRCYGLRYTVYTRFGYYRGLR